MTDFIIAIVQALLSATTNMDDKDEDMKYILEIKAVGYSVAIGVLASKISCSSVGLWRVGTVEGF